MTSTPNARAVLCLLYAMMRHNYILATSFSIFAFIWYSLNGYVVFYQLCLTQPLTSIEQLSPVQFSGCCCFEQRQINWTNFFASTQATQQRNILFLWYVTFNTCFQILRNQHQLILRKSVVGSAFLNWISPPQILFVLWNINLTCIQLNTLNLYYILSDIQSGLGDSTELYGCSRHSDITATVWPQSSRRFLISDCNSTARWVQADEREMLL